MHLSTIAHACAHNAHGRLRVSPATAETYTVAAARLLEYFGDIDITTITPAELLAFQDWLESRGTAVATENKYKRTVRAMWNLLRRRGINVCTTTLPDGDTLWRFRREPRRVKSVSEKNAHRLLAFSGIRDTLLLLMARDSARRRGGLARLRIDDCKIIHLEDGELGLVGHTIEKGDKPQLLLCGHHTALLYQVWLRIRADYLESIEVEDPGTVFINLETGAALAPYQMTRTLMRLRQRARIPKGEPSSLHSFRHARAKQLLNGLPLPVVRDLLGHADSATTADIYAVNGEEELIEAFFNF